MADMEVDAPAPSAVVPKAKTKDDGKEAKKRFEVRKVSIRKIRLIEVVC